MGDILKDSNGLWLKDNFFDYQWRGHSSQCSMAASALWVPMSGGKTIMTLSSIVHLQQSDNWLGPVLVVGPKRVVQTVWHIEAAKWQHTRHLRFSTILGDVQQRTRALATPAHVYLTNYENLKWLAGAINRYYLSRGHVPPFNGVVFDELTKMKNASTNRVTEFRKILPYMKWRTGLTGTPASNGYIDLHGQYLVLDDGARLGTSKNQFTERFCVASGYMGYGSKVTERGEQEIRSLISDMTFYLAEEEVAKLPDLIVSDIEVPLPPDLREKYDAFERDMFIELDSGVEIEVFNAAAKTNKALQFSNGAVYLQPGQPESEVVHDLKLDALEDIIEEAAGAPILVAYNFRTDAARIMERFKALKPVNLTESKDPAGDIAKWRAGETRLMIGHPASMGHGIDGLQDRGNILVWFGLGWSLELYLQFNGRLRRQNAVSDSVRCYRILVPDTLDMAVRDAIEGKAQTEEDLKRHIHAYQRGRGL